MATPVGVPLTLPAAPRSLTAALAVVALATLERAAWLALSPSGTMPTWCKKWFNSFHWVLLYFMENFSMKLQNRGILADGRAV